MDRNRKKLIEELIRVGRLIDPAPSPGLLESKNSAKISGITEKPDIDNSTPGKDLEDLPVVGDVFDPPYATKDMFPTSVDVHVPSTAKHSDLQQPEEPISQLTNVHANKHQESALINQEAASIGFPLKELARELVTLIEDRVSRRSGEQLDDTFRDELTEAVTMQLEGWLKYK